jgi:hypothetical protein
MSERSFNNTWKGKEKKVSKTFSPMIGMIYEGVDKFFGNTVIGILTEIHEDNDEAVLRARGGVLVSVDKKSLKIVA